MALQPAVGSNQATKLKRVELSALRQNLKKPCLCKALADDSGFCKLDCDLQLFLQLVQIHGQDDVGEILDYCVVFNAVVDTFL